MSKQQVQLKEKELSIEDLKNTDHVGFVDNTGKKAYLVCINTQTGHIALTANLDNGQNSYWMPSDSLIEAIRAVDAHTAYTVAELYRFDSRKELYQWLAED